MAEEHLQSGGKRRSDKEYNEAWLRHVRSKTVTSETGCWLWQGFINPAWGYGQMSYRGRTNNVHRWMYQVVHGVKLVRAQYVCHTCDVRHCCNPDHLWVGSNSENQKDSSHKSRHYESRRTHCEHGHEFTPENTKLRPMRKGFARICMLCERERHSSPEARARINARQLLKSRLQRGWTLERALTKPPRPWRGKSI